MKRIAIFHPVDDRYGASKILAYVLSFLSREYKCDVYIPALTHEIELTLQELVSHDVNVNFIEFPCAPLVHRKMYSLKGLYVWVWQNIRTLRFLMKLRKDYEIVYINTVALFSISLICRMLNVKNMVHCHEYLKGSLYGEVIRRIIRFGADKIVCVSAKVASYIGDNPKVVVIHNGIPDVTLRVTERASSTPDDMIHFAMVGRVMPEKGQWFLCEAVKNLPDYLKKKIKIHVYGDAPPTRSHLFKEFKSLISDAQLDSVFVLHGFDPDASIKASLLDVWIIPSIMVDPFPTTVIEGLRASKVVLTTDNGGASEIIKDGVNGFLIKHGDVQYFTNLLSSFLQLSSEERKNIQQQARMTYEQSYGIEKFQDRFEIFFNDVIKNKA
ncbi:glycosyltransferase family 4 protein [Kosakonia sp. R1.Fl]|uniref:glycosyltransferase family 4 protein n=1 Tax=Kosakonia sp. R1.Fl TaxID=2928706 RepID=UPI00201DC61C|nr:glycosyltransferase family 4 protein [Kosakonia sp. R1.Fl]MCL6744976.1 glycosyltransferase family 4 protein [Kosakonia sp. R1.Fl]